MDTKKKATGVAVTEGAAQGALRRGAARELSLEAEEEKVMRMRLGASVKRTDKLERIALPDSDAGIEILAYEIEAYLCIREMRRGAAVEMRGGQAALPSRAKEKIIRALRKKK